VKAELFHADRRTEGRTDMMKLKVAFFNFTNAPKKGGGNKGKRLRAFLFDTITFTASAI
jgi:hypothetical protein